MRRAFSSQCLFGLATVLTWCASCDDVSSPNPPRPVVVLARVDTFEITDVDFDEALAKLDVTDADPPLEQWRGRLQMLIDRQLLLMEARERGFYDHPRVVGEVERWQRSQLIEKLIDRELRASPDLEAGAARKLFHELGADREVLIGRLPFTDRSRAEEALERVRSGDSSFEELRDHYPPSRTGGSGHVRWLSSLTVSEPRLRSLLRAGAGAAELTEEQEGYVLLVAISERTVPFEELRQQVERVHVHRQRAEARSTLLVRLMEEYAAEVNGSAVAALRAEATAGLVDSTLVLVRSVLGNWTVGDYLTAAEGSPEPDRTDGDSSHSLERQILYSFATERLIAAKAAEARLSPPPAEQLQMERNRRAVEALWDEEALSRIAISQADVRRYFARHRERYASDLAVPGAAAGVWARVERELKEERAKPLFNLYLTELRRRYESVVTVDEDRFYSFVAGLRRNKAPVQL